jgi:pimeloyl-ACP methyl ester carboxylesterase
MTVVQVNVEHLALAATDVSVDGMLVHALVRPGPRPVVFVHGLANSSAYFDDAGERHELEGRGIVALDLPGFGRTAAPEGFGFTMEEQAQVVGGLVDALGLSDLTLVGHSMGGTIAVLAAYALGARLAELVVAEGKLQLEPNVWSSRIAAEPPESWERTFADMQRRAEIVVRGGMLRRRVHAIRRAAPALRQTTARAMQASAIALQTTASDPTLYERFMTLDRPRRYLFGDQNVHVTLFKRLEADGATIGIVPRAGHQMMLDNPTGFYAEVARGQPRAHTKDYS